MDRASREAPEKKAVDSPEGQLPVCSQIPRAFNIVENPLELGSREIRIEQQTGATLHCFAKTLGSQLVTIRGCTAVLPDNGVIDRSTGLTVPNDSSLSLVCDSDSGNRTVRDLLADFAANAYHA